jgi:hypothetical protein
MRSFHRLAGQGSIQLAIAFVAVGSWLSGCGDDEKSSGGGGKGGTSGTAGASGAAGSTNAGSGGTTAGAAGNAGAGISGAGGTPGGSGGVAGSAGSAGMGGVGEGGEGGEGGVGDGGMSGTAGTGGMSGTAGMAGAGGEGGATTPTCASADLSFNELNSTQNHDHLPVGGMNRTTLLSMINTGMPLVFTMPTDGMTDHTHTITFTAGQLTTLRNGGTIAMITTSMGGPAMNMHTHTYSIECEP